MNKSCRPPSAVGQPADGTNFRADSNVDGTINSADATIIRANSGNGLPAADAAPERAKAKAIDVFTERESQRVSSIISRCRRQLGRISRLCYRKGLDTSPCT